MKVISAKCPDCGSPIALADDGRTAKCICCGSECFLTDDQLVKIVIQRDQSEAVNLLLLAKEAYKSDNFSEAYRYCGQLLERDPQNPEAWLLKGLSAAWKGSLANGRLQEMVSGFEKCNETNGVSLISEFGLPQAILIAKARTNAWYEHKEKYWHHDDNVRVEWQQALVELVGVLDQLSVIHESEALAVTISEIATKAGIDIYIREFMTEVKNKHESWLTANSTAYSNSLNPAPNETRPTTVTSGKGIGTKTVVAIGIFVSIVILLLVIAASTGDQVATPTPSPALPSAPPPVLHSVRPSASDAQDALEFLKESWKKEAVGLGLNSDQTEVYIRNRHEETTGKKAVIHKDAQGKIISVTPE